MQEEPLPQHEKEARDKDWQISQTEVQEQQSTHQLEKEEREQERAQQTQSFQMTES